jgi:STE24 endopeptidase
MPFLILLFLVLAAQPLPWPESPFGWGDRGSLWATVVAIALPVLAAFWLAGRTRRRLLTMPADRESTVRAYQRGRTLHLFLLLGTQFVILGLLGWGWTVHMACGAYQSDSSAGGELVWSPEEMPFGVELLLIGPFLIGLVLSWAAFYTAERTLSGSRRPFGGRIGYVVFLSRQYLAVVGIPLVLMMTARGLQWAVGQWANGTWVLVGMAGMVGTTLVLAPWPLRLILGARSLPAGPIRTRLEAAARRLKFRYSDILLWDTRQGVANAMVAGPLPWVRYVFLSDRLLEELTPAEVEAVFGHEVGHVRHGHFLYYVTFMFLSVTALIGCWMLVWPEGESQAWKPWEAVPQMLLIASYVFVVFGFLSRRCERQADVYGCRAVSCADGACVGHDEGEPGASATGVILPPEATGLCPTGIRTFIAALDKVADVNGISRRKPGLLNAWLHGTIARRVEFLERMIADARTERRFQRRLGLLKWGLLTGLAAGVLVLAAGHWDEIAKAVWAA